MRAGHAKGVRLIVDLLLKKKFFLILVSRYLRFCMRVKFYFNTCFFLTRIEKSMFTWFGHVERLDE